MKTGVIIQARMGSTRLPGKVLLPLCGGTVLSTVIKRASDISGVDEVIVATGMTMDNRPVMEEASRCGVSFFAGSEQDVLDRYYMAAKCYGLNTIVRITADCPMLDPEISSQVVARYLKGGHDYVSNVHPPTFPDGLDTEVFSFKVLERTARLAKEPFEREHVTPYVWRWPSLFKLQNIWNEQDLSSHRWTLDTIEDYTFVSEVFKRLGSRFSMKDALALDISHTKYREIVL